MQTYKRIKLECEHVVPRLFELVLRKIVLWMDKPHTAEMLDFEKLTIDLWDVVQDRHEQLNPCCADCGRPGCKLLHAFLPRDQVMRQKLCERSADTEHHSQRNICLRRTRLQSL